MYIRSNKRKLQAIETKNRIFDIAHAMFRERGFYNVTVEEIADAANISVGALYHHFKNKYELLTAWHDDSMSSTPSITQRLKKIRHLLRPKLLTL